MIASYVRTSLRKLRRTRAHTLINVAGLTLGFLGALVIFQKVRYELSFDTFHPDAERIYRVVRSDTQFGEVEHDTGVPYPFVDAFRLDFPDVEHVTIVDRNFNAAVISAVRSDGQVVRFKEEEGIAFVHADYFDLFPRTWVRGDPATAFAAPRSAVLSESLARKYFGPDDPMGRTITYDATLELTVTGIVRDAPRNTALPLDLLITFDLGEANRRGNDSWGSTSSSVQCFLKLPPALTAAAVDRQLTGFLARHRNEDVTRYLRYFLQPVTEMHFDTRFGSGPVISRDKLQALGLIAFILLLTACINFVNLNTVLVFRRAREVGVRKMLGGTPRQIRAYFMTETALITLAALAAALLLAGPVLRLARPFVGDAFAVNPFTDPVLAGAAVAAALLLSLFSGLYPASLLARLQPTEALRNRAGQRPGAFLTLRRSLVVVQFAISQLLIICTLAAMYQMRYLNDVPLGFDTEAVVEFAVPVRDDTRLQTLRAQILRSPAVERVGFSNTGATSGNTWGSNFYYAKGQERLENETQIKFVDTDYLDVYGMTLVAGAWFAHADSVTGAVMNESGVRAMGFSTPDEALGTLIETWDWKVPLVGVVRDFNTNSLHQQIETTLLLPTRNFAQTGAAKVRTERLDEAVAAIEAAWEEAYPAHVFEYTFLDDRIAQLYEDEQRTQQLIQAFALIAIAIGCIGLFGLISHTTTQRAREVGIRKVLGASVPSIVGLFTREFALMVVLGFVVSAPVAYHVMSRWLENFAYRIDLGAGLFAAAFAISLALALLTVGYKTVRAAAVNPVDVIRYD